VTVQVLRCDVCNCADTAVWGCVIVQILMYGLCDIADTALWFV